MTPETAPTSPQAQRQAPGHGSGPPDPPQASHGAGNAKGEGMNDTAHYRNVACRIKITDPNLLKKAGLVAYKRHKSSGFDGKVASCADCKYKWELSPFTDIETVTCSKCYGDNVYLVGLRLWFPKWSEKR